MVFRSCDVDKVIEINESLKKFVANANESQPHKIFFNDTMNEIKNNKLESINIVQPNIYKDFIEKLTNCVTSDFIDRGNFKKDLLYEIKHLKTNKGFKKNLIKIAELIIKKSKKEKEAKKKGGKSRTRRRRVRRRKTNKKKTRKAKKKTNKKKRKGNKKRKTRSRTRRKH